MKDADFAFPQNIVRGLGAAPAGSAVQSRPTSPTPVNVEAKGVHLNLTAQQQLQARLPKGFSVVSMSTPVSVATRPLWLDPAKSQIVVDWNTPPIKWPSGWISPSAVAKLPTVVNANPLNWVTIKWDATGDVLGLAGTYVYLAGGPMYFVLALAGQGSQAQAQAKEKAAVAAATKAAQHGESWANKVIANTPTSPVFGSGWQTNSGSNSNLLNNPALTYKADFWARGDEMYQYLYGPLGAAVTGTWVEIYPDDPTNQMGIASHLDSELSPFVPNLPALIKTGLHSGWMYFAISNAGSGAAQTPGEPPGVVILRARQEPGTVFVEMCTSSAHIPRSAAVGY